MVPLAEPPAGTKNSSIAAQLGNTRSGTRRGLGPVHTTLTWPAKPSTEVKVKLLTPDPMSDIFTLLAVRVKPGVAANAGKAKGAQQMKRNSRARANGRRVRKMISSWKG
jgi:hypothetical protein